MVNGYFVPIAELPLIRKQQHKGRWIDNTQKSTTQLELTDSNNKSDETQRNIPKEPYTYKRNIMTL